MNRCVVGLLADPGLPSAIARDLVDLLPDHLGREVDGAVEWTLHSTQEPFEVAPDAERVIDKALSESGVVVADISTSDRRPAGPVEFLRIALMASVLGLLRSRGRRHRPEVAHSTREQQRRGQIPECGRVATQP